MREEYVIEAYSPSLNQSVREFQLESSGPASITDLQSAQQLAGNFSIRLNQQLGIETMPGFVGFSK